MLPRKSSIWVLLFGWQVLIYVGAMASTPIFAERDDPDLPIGTPREQFAAIKAKLDAARAEYIRQLEKATTTEERNQLSRSVPKTEPFARQMLLLAERHAGDPVALDALIWVTGNTPTGTDAAGILNLKAKEAIVKDFAESERIAPFAQGLAWPASARSESMLRQLLQRNKTDQVRAFVEYALAQQLMTQLQDRELFQIRREIAADEEAKRQIEESIDKEYDAETAKLLRTRDPQSVSQEVEGLLSGLAANKTVASAKWRPANSKLTLNETAARDLEVLRNLACGKPAPAIEGTAIAGEAIALKNYKGKVVLLNFTGHWCIACRRLYPLERELTKKYQDGPFAILNVNSDPTVDLVKKLMQQEKMTWPVIWDGGTTEGPLATRWNVQGWPLVVLIDHEGVIRYKFRGAPIGAILNPLVDRLVVEARAKAGK